MKDEVLVIEDGVLKECTDKSITSVVIPDSVKKIVEDAFYCCSSLSSVEFGGTVAQWKAVKKEDASWKHGIPATCVKCADGEAEINAK